MSRKKEEKEPDTSIQLFGESIAVAVGSYKNSCQAATHSGRLMAFSEFLRAVFGIDINDIAPKVEKYRSQVIHTLRGRPDLPFGDVIIEMKTDLHRERQDAWEELSRYGPLLATKADDTIPVGLITDGLQFEVYTFELAEGRPKIDAEGRFIVDEKPIESFDINYLTPEEFCLRLDSLLFKSHPKPTSSDLALRFGIGSPTFYAVMAALERAYAACKKDIATRFEQWERNMTIVYGSSPGSEAFLGHTYLVLLSRFLLDIKINGEIRTEEEVAASVRGERLAQLGLGGREGGYFDWVIEPSAKKHILPKLKKLTDQLSLYDFRDVRGDLFRAIYQEIVTREVRHQTGEYYTPQWLAELIIEKTIQSDDTPSVLDPACGSGTFLAAAIEALRKRGLHLQDVLAKVIGIDMNPMAVEIAKATYLLALGQLIKERVHEIDIPIYVADSLRLPRPKLTIEESLPIFEFTVYGKTLAIPQTLSQNEKVFLTALHLQSTILEEYEHNSLGKEESIKAMSDQFLKIFKDRPRKDDECRIMSATLTILIDLIDAKKDSIWIFLLKNLYAPARLSQEKFDLIIGNPPWIALRYIADDKYQDFIKERMKDRKLMNPKLPQLITQTEIATLFFVEACRLYLKKNGRIAFVMPRSVITGAKQHESFQKLKNPRLMEIIDLAKVKPLFNVPACVLMANNKGNTKFPVAVTRVEGELSRKDASLSETREQLSFSKSTWTPSENSNKDDRSPYYDKFSQGATLVPRSCWFIDFISHPTLGLNPEKPSVRSSSEAIRKSKKPWGNVKIEGAVESRYIFLTILGSDIASFGSTALKPIVLPIARDTSGKYLLKDVPSLHTDGDTGMAQWLIKCQSYWDDLSTMKARDSCPRIIDWINYRKKITSQDTLRFAIVYPASGTHVASFFLDTHNLPPIEIAGQTIHPAGFVADAKTYVFRTDSEEEALFLVGVLNSAAVNDRIKKSQSQGTFGPRDIHMRPLELPIPLFNPKKPEHLRITALTKSLIEQANVMLSSGKKGRKKFRSELVGINELDELVAKLIS